MVGTARTAVTDAMGSTGSRLRVCCSRPAALAHRVPLAPLGLLVRTALLAVPQAHRDPLALMESMGHRVRPDPLDLRGRRARRVTCCNR